MRILIQRVSEASVQIEGKTKSEIDKGLLIFVGIENEDSEDDIDFLAKKSVNLRIFDDENGVMNRSILDSGGDILVISQFTLYGDVKNNNRPSFTESAPKELAEYYYEKLIEDLKKILLKRKILSFCLFVFDSAFRM